MRRDVDGDVEAVVLAEARGGVDLAAARFVDLNISPGVESGVHPDLVSDSCRGLSAIAAGAVEDNLLEQ